MNRIERSLADQDGLSAQTALSDYTDISDPPAAAPSAIVVTDGSPGPFHLIYKGVNYSADIYQSFTVVPNSLPTIVAIGGNSIAVTTNFGIDAENNTIYQNDVSGGFTESNADIAAAVANAGSLGLSVMVRPLIDFLPKDYAFDPNPLNGSYYNDEFRNYYNPGAAGSAGANSFFASYETMIVAQAKLAQANGASLFCIGAELDQITGPAYKTYWTDIITAVRAVFTGKLTYSALWDDNQSYWQYQGTGLAAGTGDITTQISFWKSLDYIGIDEYAPISDLADPTLAQLITGWTQTSTDATTDAVTGGQSLINYYEGISASLGMPLIFTELGYANSSDADSTPATPGYDAEGNPDSATPDPTLQANLYQAFFDAWQQDGNSDLAGAYLWDWEPNGTNANSASGGWSVQGEPAQTVVTTGFITPATLTKPIIVPQYGNGVIDLYTPDPSTGAPTLDSKYTVDVQTILNNLFGAGAGLVAAPNAVVLHGNNLFFTNSSPSSQAVFELPDYLVNPAAAIANAFVVTLDGGDYVGLAFDVAGHLYTAEGPAYGNNSIVEYTLPTTPPTTGKVGDNYTSKTVIGDAGETSYFGDLTFDSSGNLWVADYLNSRVVVFDAANLGSTDTWHSITDAAGALAVANTTSGLTAATGDLFAEPEGVAFDGTGSSANLWVGNNDDGGGSPSVVNTLDSLVEITPALQSLILATPDDTAVSAADIEANSSVFVYQVPDNADSSRPQFGGLAIDTTAGVLYANEEVGGDARAYTLSSIAATPLDPSSTELPLTTTNPGNGGLALVTSTLPCFREGTRIATPDAEVAVEALRAGQLVRTAAGEAKPVRWIGHRRVDCRRHPKPEEVWPVRVQAHAFGPGRPHRDLWLSPDHAVLVGDELIPIRYLVNGASVYQEPRNRITYYHVELAAHEVLLAEGLPAESYLDTGNRSAFVAGGTAVMATPDFARHVWVSSGCAPLVTDGARLIAARRALRQRAEALGHVPTTEAALRLIVDGQPLAPVCQGNGWRVEFPAGARTVAFVSRGFVPAHMDPAGDDHRVLGVAVQGLALDGVVLAPDDDRWGAGWHAAERGWRWTDGAAVLAITDARTLVFDVVMTGHYWQDTQHERREGRL